MLVNSRDHVHEWQRPKRKQGFGIFGNDLVLVNDLETDMGLYRYRDDIYFQQDLQDEQAGAADDLRKRLYAYLQIVTNSVRNDRVYRDPR